MILSSQLVHYSLALNKGKPDIINSYKLIIFLNIKLKYNKIKLKLMLETSSPDRYTIEFDIQK